MGFGCARRVAATVRVGVCSRRLTFEFTRLRKRAKPAVALRVQRGVRRHTGSYLSKDLIASSRAFRSRFMAAARSRYVLFVFCSDFSRSLM